jgi:hypothetical protein
LEATTTVGAYNMVSRLLVALDVDDKSQMKTPIPVVAKVQVGSSPEESLHAVYIPAAEPTDKTVILVNSLMTNYKMWRLGNVIGQVGELALVGRSKGSAVASLIVQHTR